eukprot:gene4954-biopygen12890
MHMLLWLLLVIGAVADGSISAPGMICPWQPVGLHLRQELLVCPAEGTPSINPLERYHRMHRRRPSGRKLWELLDQELLHWEQQRSGPASSTYRTIALVSVVCLWAGWAGWVLWPRRRIQVDPVDPPPVMEG